MTYLKCDEAIQFCKDAYEKGTIFYNEQQVHKELIEPMNKAYTDDVYYLNVKKETKYVKINCKIPKCPFSIWLNYCLG